RQAALEQARKAVIEVLDIVLGVRHLDEAQFPPLVECQKQARDLHATVLALNESNLHQAQELTARVRAFSDFLTMLEGSDQMDDERFAALEASVSAAFGRPLAVAAARGRLLRPGQTPPPAPAQPPAAVAQTPPATPLPTATPPMREPAVVAAAAPPAPAPVPAAPSVAPTPPVPPPAPSAPTPAPPRVSARAARAPEPPPAKAKPAAAAAASSSEASFDETAQWW